MKEKHKKKKKKKKEQQREEPQQQTAQQQEQEETKAKMVPDAEVAPPRPRRLVKVRTACKYGDISRTKLYEKIKLGTVLAYRRDGQTVIDLDSIDAMHAALPRVILRGMPP